MNKHRGLVVRGLAILGLALFMTSVLIVLGEIANPIADEANLEVAGSPAAQYGADHPDEFVHIVGALSVLLVGASGIVGLVVRPQSRSIARHVVAAMLASTVVMGIMGDPDNHGGMAGPFDVAFLVFVVFALMAGVLALVWTPADGAPPDRHGWYVFAAGFPLLWYGAQQALLQRNTWPPLADPHHQAHWYTMGVLALMVVFTATTASLWPDRSGLTLAVSATAAALLGLSSLLRPDAASAMNWPFATVAIAFAGAVMLQRRVVDQRRSDLDRRPTARAGEGL